MEFSFQLVSNSNAHKVRAKINVVVGVLISMVAFVGCCPDVEHGPNAIYEALTRFELSTFVDSAGNYEQILLVGEGMDRIEDDWNECAHAVGYAQFPYAEFDFLHSNRTLRYEQYESRMLFFPHFGTWYSSTGGWNEVYTIQDVEYSTCSSYSRSDSTGQIYSVILDKYYGLVMFSYRNEYRWERVPD